MKMRSNQEYGSEVLSIDFYMKTAIIDALNEEGNVVKASIKLGIPRSTLRDKISQYNIIKNKSGKYFISKNY